MTDKELIELKKIVDDAVISSYADFTLEEGYHLVCLIEEEQHRRSVRSEDVQRAIETLKDAVSGAIYIDSDYIEYPIKCEELEVIITALEAYQKPIEELKEDRDYESAKESWNQALEGESNG